MAKGSAGDGEERHGTSLGLRRRGVTRGECGSQLLGSVLAGWKQNGEQKRRLRFGVVPSARFETVAGQLAKG